jgi:hypothetical protein
MVTTDVFQEHKCPTTEQKTALPPTTYFDRYNCNILFEM